MQQFLLLRKVVVAEDSRQNHVFEVACVSCVVAIGGVCCCVSKGMFETIACYS